ncbi:MAG: LysR family transcriptional regulator [Oligoflexales bacterium]|nr:LysR family transcriptional regulator [Oligoflexales bacterium]
MFNFNHLYYFYISAKAGNINTAAKHLKISQPSLSSQLKVLEQTLNIKLFRKVGRANQLTKAGIVIYSFCRRMFVVSEEMSEVILQRLPSATRCVNIGVSNEIERSFVIAAVNLFIKKYELESRPKVNMVAGTYEQLIEKLRFQELDAIITEHAMGDADLTNIVHSEFPVHLICSRQAKKISGALSGKRDALGIAAIRELISSNEAQWVMPTMKSKLRIETDRFFGKHSLKGRILFESNDVSALIRSVIDDIGCAFMPVVFVATELRNKIILSFGPSKGYWKHEIWLGCHNQSQNDALIQSLALSFKEASGF